MKDIEKTKSGFPKRAFHIFSNNYSIIISPRPCEKCGKISILKDIVDDKFVCFACFKRHEEFSDKERELIRKAFEKRREELINQKGGIMNGK